MPKLFASIPARLSVQHDPRLPGEPALSLMPLEGLTRPAWVLRVGPFKVYAE